MNKKQHVKYLGKEFHLSKIVFFEFLMCCFSLAIFSKKIFSENPKKKIFKKCNFLYLRNNAGKWLYKPTAWIHGYIAILSVVIALYYDVESTL